MLHTSMSKKELKSRYTEDMLQAVADVLKARVKQQMVEEDLAPMDKQLLEDMPLYECDNPEVRITDPKVTYRARDIDLLEYYEERDKRIRAKGYQVDPGYCPALIAGCETMDAEHHMIKMFQPLTGLTKDDLFCQPDGLEKYKKYIELIIGLSVSLFEKKIRKMGITKGDKQ